MSRTKTPLYRELASVLQARANCARSSDHADWFDRHSATLRLLVKNYLPSGSGIDSGTTLDVDASTPEKLVFAFGYHHMDENGMYDGWTEHTLTVRPSLLSGIDLRISGRNRNDVKDYLYEIYQYALTSMVWQTEDCEWHSALYEPQAAE